MLGCHMFPTIKETGCIRQQNLKLYRSLVAASEAAAAKADARQEKLLKLMAEEVANEPPSRKN